MKPEARLRARCRMWLDQFLDARHGHYSAIEHGRLHHGTPAQRGAEWERLKAQGVKPGLPDLMIWLRGRFVAVELKAGRNTTSDHQDGFRDGLVTLGHHYEVARSVTDLHGLLSRYGVPMAPAAGQIASEYDTALKNEGGEKPRGKRAHVRAAHDRTQARLAVLDRARAKGVFA